MGATPPLGPLRGFRGRSHPHNGQRQQPGVLWALPDLWTRERLAPTRSLDAKRLAPTAPTGRVVGVIVLAPPLAPLLAPCRVTPPTT